MRNIKGDEIKEKKSWSKTFANQILGEYMELQRYADRFGIILLSPAPYGGPNCENNSSIDE